MLKLSHKHIKPLTLDELCKTYNFGYIMVMYKSQVSTHLEF